MTGTTKTAEAVIQKRPSVPYPDVFNWREGDAVAFLDDRACARVGAALSGARAITAILMQHDLDRNNDEHQEAGLRLSEITTHGLFEALASCLELAELQAVNGNMYGSTTAQAKSPEAEAMRNAAFNASVSMDNRSARARVEQLDKQAAARAARTVA